ncbi:hypothetical protein BDM02DRAFT_3115184 [Thelephora ganbajun]|uniref:Uncharacterized protein n=1 Tax=Thelephora ganbajun TaxID=370292 RepID=A0ACB6ZG69_THEGA|nr:hypothetical protein BDM02DRAFT_3115184 [Thelephora ganbajun]
MAVSLSKNAFSLARSKTANSFRSFGVTSTSANQIVRQHRRDTSARTLSTHPGQSSSHFDVQPFSPYPVAGGTTFSRAGLMGRYNLAFGHLADRGDLIQCLQLAAQMKAQGIKPDVLTYNCLIRACGREALAKQAAAIFEDMLAVGLQPERETFHSLFKAHSQEYSSVLLSLWKKMLEAEIIPNAMSYEILIAHLTKEDNLEMALTILTEMEKRDLSPSTETAESIVLLAAKQGNPRLALDLTTSYETVSVRPLSTATWVQVLASCAEYLFGEGVDVTWRKTVKDLNVIPDEGLCLDILHTCGRNGMPALASEVLSVLTEQKIPLGEHHFSPLLEALCHRGLVKDAFLAIMRMDAVGITPTMETTYPLFKYIIEDAERLETACNHLEDLQQEVKTPFHVAAFNCVIRASISLGDLQRAIGLYNSLSEFKVKPNVDTYNLLLGGCIATTHRELGDKLLLEMKEAHVLPDARTYERLIILCLTQTNYEDAFFYLEEMKEQKMIPSLNIYESLIRKCVTMGDTRYKLAVEESTSPCRPSSTPEERAKSLQTTRDNPQNPTGTVSTSTNDLSSLIANLRHTPAQIT